MRGEEAVSMLYAMADEGSPPHARGREDLKQVSRSVKRITPACAGKRPGSIVISVAPKDHPRMRGEESTWRDKEQRKMGSPPHARGRGAPGLAVAVSGGITPACAGKSLN